MKAAQDGLMPDGREAVLNIYKTKVKGPNGDEWVPMVQYLPMVRGILKTVRNSGQIAHVDAAAVYAKDEFKFQRGDDPKIIHEPYLGEEDPGPVVAAYMIVKLDNGEVHREVMPRRDIEKTRAASKAGDSTAGPWAKWYDQMAIKAVIKRAAKLLPTSSEALDRVIQNDNDAMGFDFAQPAMPTIEHQPAKQLAAPKHQSRRLAALVKQDTVPAEASEAPVADAAPADDAPAMQAAE
jgi:recombination protein RecT